MHTLADNEDVQHIRQHGFAGNITVKNAWQMMQRQADAVMVDVRTEQEWEQGVPDFSSMNKTLVRLSWMISPGEVNPGFVNTFTNLPVRKDTPVMLICKSGGRSQAAAIALTQAGYSCCLNVQGGFEGEGGWRAAGLPWTR